MYCKKILDRCLYYFSCLYYFRQFRRYKNDFDNEFDNDFDNDFDNEYLNVPDNICITQPTINNIIIRE